MNMKLTAFLLLTALCSSCASGEANTVHVTRNKMNNRVEFIEKNLSAADLAIGSPLTEEVRNHVKKSSAPGDVVGVIIDEKLGGLGNETYNAVPMNPSAQQIWQTKVIDPTFDYLTINKNQEVSFMFIPLYENFNSTRPYGLAVFIIKISDNSNAHLVKGYIPNPTKAASESVAPYIYHTGNVWHVARKNESFDIVGVGGDQSRLERVEVANKVVRRSDLTTGTELDDFSRNHTRKLAGDQPYVPGLLLSKNLGGKGDDPYNVVPMNPKAVEEFITRVEAPTLAFFSDPANKDAATAIIVFVMYADYISARPVGFIVLNRQSQNVCTYIPNQR